MPKKKASPKKTSRLGKKTTYFFVVIFLVNIISLYIHNDLLPIIYAALTLSYYILHCSITAKGKVHFDSGLSILFLKNKFKTPFFLAWGLIVFFPSFFALYYFDFVLLLITLLVNSAITTLILKENKLI